LQSDMVAEDKYSMKNFSFLCGGKKRTCTTSQVKEKVIRRTLTGRMQISSQTASHCQDSSIVSGRFPIVSFVPDLATSHRRYELMWIAKSPSDVKNRPRRMCIEP